MASARVWGGAPSGAQGRKMKPPSSKKVFSLERPKEGRIVWFVVLIGRLYENRHNTRPKAITADNRRD